MRLRTGQVVALFIGFTPLAAQDNALAAGIAAMDRHDLPGARVQFEAVLQRDPISYEANWRLSHVLVDQGKVTPDAVQRTERDALYELAVRYARRAVAANPGGANGHFMVASALGRASLVLGNRERVRMAGEIRTEALRALSIDPTHSGAYHVLGRWHAEICRLSAVERFVARRFRGGNILELASWPEAERNLRLAVRHGPDRIYHRLDLALILLDRDKPAEARQQLQAISGMSPREPMDTTYQREAALLLKHAVTHSPT
jgi:tetratricopeptide (TPR) repeat protein